MSLYNLACPKHRKPKAQNLLLRQFLRRHPSGRWYRSRGGRPSVNPSQGRQDHPTSHLWIHYPCSVPGSYYCSETSLPDCCFCQPHTVQPGAWLLGGPGSSPSDPTVSQCLFRADKQKAQHAFHSRKVVGSEPAHAPAGEAWESFESQDSSKVMESLLTREGQLRGGGAELLFC